MNWKNASKDGLPLNNEEVLISLNGINHVAVYDVSEKGFQIKNNGKFIPIQTNGPTVYWTSIVRPYPKDGSHSG